MWIMNSKFTHFLSLNLIQPLYNVVLPPSLTYVDRSAAVGDGEAEGVADIDLGIYLYP